MGKKDKKVKMSQSTWQQLEPRGKTKQGIRNEAVTSIIAVILIFAFVMAASFPLKYVVAKMKSLNLVLVSNYCTTEQAENGKYLVNVGIPISDNVAIKSNGRVTYDTKDALVYVIKSIEDNSERTEIIEDVSEKLEDNYEIYAPGQYLESRTRITGKTTVPVKVFMIFNDKYMGIYDKQSGRAVALSNPDGFKVGDEINVKRTVKDKKVIFSEPKALEEQDSEKEAD